MVRLHVPAAQFAKAGVRFLAVFEVGSGWVHFGASHFSIRARDRSAQEKPV